MTILPIPTNLKINGKASPLAQDRNALVFSWQLPLAMTQKAYRLVFADRAEDLEIQNYIFDTGWVYTFKSTGITVDGLGDILADDRLYHWQVMYLCEGEHDDMSFVSVPAAFTTTPVFASTHRLWHKSDLFMFARHTFEVSSSVFENMEKAVMYVTATSPEATRQYVYLAYVNGRCVGVGPTRYGKDLLGNTLLYYQAYDITSLLSQGENCLGVICYALDHQGFFCQLTVYDKQGMPTVLCNSGRDMANWSTLGGDAVFGPDASIGTHYYVAHANNLNSRIYPFGFAEVGFDGKGWSVPCDCGALSTDMTLVACPSDIMKRFVVPPTNINITKTPDGDYIIDIGKEIIGGLGLHIPHCPAMTLTIMYGEELLDPHHVKFEMRTGNKYREVWHMTANMPYVENISMMTYRYVQISGCSVDLTADMIYPLSLRCEFDDDASYFESDLPLLNDIYDLVKHTVKVTTQDLYVDAQSRERMAYEGDLVINQLAAYAFTNDLNVSRFTVEYLITHRTWPAEYPLFTVIGAWLDYMACGDASLIKAYYPALRDFVVKYMPDDTIGLVRHITTAMSTTDGILVDWPLSERDGYDMDVTYNTVFNACMVGAYRTLAAMANVVGVHDDALLFRDIADRVTNAMIDLLYDTTSGGFFDGCTDRDHISSHKAQHATAFALAFDIYHHKAMADAMANFLRTTEKIRMSVYGAFFLLSGLYRSGNGSLANTLLLSEDVSEGAHTWAAMLRTVGATITTEAWHPTGKPNMTHAHPWGAAPAHLIMSGIFGITPTSPGFETFDIRPQTQGIPSASIKIPCIKGEIHVSFAPDGAHTCITVAVPGGSMATLYVPVVAGDVVVYDDTTLSPTTTQLAEGYMPVVLSSGVHEVFFDKS